MGRICTKPCAVIRPVKRQQDLRKGPLVAKSIRSRSGSLGGQVRRTGRQEYRRREISFPRARRRDTDECLSRVFDGAKHRLT